MAREIYNLASSGLILAQRGLNISSRNISNVNVDGYSRQRLETSGIPDILEGNNKTGTGSVNGYIQRFNDNFIQSQITAQHTQLQSADTYHNLASRIDNFIADADTNLLVPMTDVFSAMQNIVADPTDSAARIDMLDRANVMAERVGTLNDQLTTLRDQVNTELASDVDEINLLARNIAEVNSHIVELQNNPNAEPPNDLLDQRDGFITALSEKINVKVINSDNGASNVFIGYGQALVSGDSYNRLALESSRHDETDKHILLIQEGQEGTLNLSTSLTGGSIGGLQKFKREVLDPTLNRMGQMAAGFALSFNSQQRAGINLDGKAGENIFTDYTNPANTRENWRADTKKNTGSATLEITFDDSPENNQKNLIPTDYELQYSDGNYTIKRLSDSQVFSTADETLKRDDTGKFLLDGLKIRVLDEATLGEGDSYLLMPLRRIADEFRIATTNPAKLAAASQPQREWRADPANVGLAQLQISFDDSPANSISNLTASDYDVRFAGGNITVSRLSDDTVYSSADGTLTVGEDGSFVVDGLKIKVANGEIPADGDVFHVLPPESDFGGIADNSNMIALSQLQTEGILDEGMYSFHQAYTQMVTSIGGKTRTAQVDTQAHESFLAQLKNKRENISGVNLDEEAANLLKYQQAYQASAQIIPIANAMFDTLLSAVR